MSYRRHPSTAARRPLAGALLAAALLVSLALMSSLTLLPQRGRAQTPATSFLVIVKINNGGPSDAQFTAAVQGPGGAAVFQFSEDQFIELEIPSAVYTVTEQPKPGYQQDGWALSNGINCPPEPTDTGPAEVDLSTPGSGKVVCFYNTLVGGDGEGTWRIMKVNKGGNPADVFKFGFLGAPGSDFSATAPYENAVVAGALKIEEKPAAGYEYLGYDLAFDLDAPCPANPSATGSVVEVNVVDGGEYRICFYNQKLPEAGTLLVKKVNKGGKPSDTFHWKFSDSPPPGVPFSVNDPYKTALSPGPRTIQELPADGYTYLGYDLAFDLDLPCPPNPTAAGNASFVGAAGGEYRVCLYNAADGHLQIRKVNNGPAGDTFTADISGGPSNVAFGENSSIVVKDLAAGPRTVTEDPKLHYTYQGWSYIASGHLPCPPKPQGTGPAQVEIIPGATATVCFYNKKTTVEATFKVTKIDLTSGHPSWAFKVSGPSAVGNIVVPGGVGSPGATKTLIQYVTVGNYTLAEIGAGPNSCPFPNLDPGAFSTTVLKGGGPQAVAEDGDVVEIVVRNEPCPVFTLGFVPTATVPPGTATPQPSATATPSAQPSSTPRPGTPGTTTTPTSPAGTPTPGATTGPGVPGTPGSPGTPGASATAANTPPVPPTSTVGSLTVAATPAPPDAGSGTRGAETWSPVLAGAAIAVLTAVGVRLGLARNRRRGERR